MVYVTTLCAGTNEISDPSWETVEREVRALDAEVRTMITLSPSPPEGPPDGDHHMTIGGGKDGAYMVYMTKDNLEFWNLTEPARAGNHEKVLMCIGGQVGEYRAHQFVSLQTALLAAYRYFQDGSRAVDLHWEHQD